MHEEIKLITMLYDDLEEKRRSLYKEKRGREKEEKRRKRGKEREPWKHECKLYPTSILDGF